MPKLLARQFEPGLLHALICATLFSVISGMPAAASAQVERKPDWATPAGKSPNLFRITPTLYRSAQLRASDVTELKSIGIVTVVGLRNFHSDEAWLKDSGIQTSRVKINTWAINDKNVVAALKAIRVAEKNGPVLLHCLHGADRTGLISAMYRMLYQNWSKQQALDELQNGGYGYHAMWKNIPHYLHNVDVEKIRRLVEQE